MQSENETNPDPESKRARQVALWLIESSAQVLHRYPNVPLKRRLIPPIETLFRMGRLLGGILSYFRIVVLFHLFILLYFGLLPHGAFYACKSLIKENYARFDFISTPALLKGATCIGLSYITIQRNQGMLETVEGIQNGTLSRQNVSQHIYQGTIGSVYDMYRGKKNLSDTLVYQDTALIGEYVEWATGSIWYATTHRASDSTRVFVKWLNRKTHFIVTLRDAFMELPVIKQMREAVKAVEDTVEHHVVRPIRETVRHGVQCLIDGFSYFGKRLIQWGKTGVLKEEQGAIA
jgi:hypothetical protein